MMSSEQQLNLLFIRNDKQALNSQLYLFLFHSGNKASQSYPCSAEIVYLVYFKLCIELSFALEDMSYLVTGYSIDTAAE